MLPELQYLFCYKKKNIYKNVNTFNGVPYIIYNWNSQTYMDQNGYVNKL